MKNHRKRAGSRWFLIIPLKGALFPVNPSFGVLDPRHLQVDDFHGLGLFLFLVAAGRAAALQRLYGFGEARHQNRVSVGGPDDDVVFAVTFAFGAHGLYKMPIRREDVPVGQDSLGLIEPAAACRDPQVAVGPELQAVASSNVQIKATGSKRLPVVSHWLPERADGSLPIPRSGILDPRHFQVDDLHGFGFFLVLFFACRALALQRLHRLGETRHH
jgi:hypothetical protein